MTRLYTEEALRFIEANRGGRFFLYLGHAMPHLPFDASEKFKGKSARGLYGDVVEELDESTGRILGKIRELGLAENTLVIFTSDNGPERRTPGSAAPLRGTKHTIYEGGLRVPCIAWWPGSVAADQVCDEFVSTLDLFPSFATLAGAPLPESELDGYDVSPLLLGKEGARSPRTTLFSLYGYKERRLESMREGRWKLVLGKESELYDLQADLAESTNLASKHPDIVQKLTSLAETMRRETGVGE
jgi:arylsulfatase